MTELNTGGAYGYLPLQVDMGQKVSEGLKLGQQARLASALQGFDITNPDEMNKAASAMVAGGQASQASALSEYTMAGLKRKAFSTPPPPIPGALAGTIAQPITPAMPATLGKPGTPAIVGTPATLGTPGTPEQLVVTPGQPVGASQPERQTVDEAVLQGSIANDFEQAAGMAGDPVRFDAFKNQVREKYKGLIPDELLDRELSGDPMQMMAKSQAHREAAQAALANRPAAAEAPAGAQAPAGAMPAGAAPMAPAGPSTYEATKALSEEPEGYIAPSSEGDTNPDITPTGVPGEYMSEMTGAAAPRRKPAPVVPAATAAAPDLTGLVGAPTGTIIPEVAGIPGTPEIPGTAAVAAIPGTPARPAVYAPEAAPTVKVTPADEKEAESTTGMSIKMAKYYTSPEYLNWADTQKAFGIDHGNVIRIAESTLAVAKGAAESRAKYQVDIEMKPQLAVLEGMTKLMTTGNVSVPRKDGGADQFSSGLEAMRAVTADTDQSRYGNPSTVMQNLLQAQTAVEMQDVIGPNGEVTKQPVTKASMIAQAGGPSTGTGEVKQLSIVKNNNPGALEFADWQTNYGGEKAPDGRFAKFPTEAAGIRAQEAMLANDYIGKGINTVDKIVDRYAPASKENSAESVANYKKSVASKMGVDMNTELTAKDVGKLGMAMRDFETGGATTGGAAAGPRVGTQSPSTVAYNNAQSESYIKALKGLEEKEGNGLTRMQNIPTEIQRGLEIKGLAQKYTQNNLTPLVNEMAKRLSPFIPAMAQHAGDVGQLIQDLAAGSASVLNKGSNVKNETEYNAVTSAIPKLGDQKQQLVYYGASYAAAKMLEQAQAEALMRYDKMPNSQKKFNNFQEYWETQPAYKNGIYGVRDSNGNSPWAGVTLGTANGKPVPLIQYFGDKKQLIIGAGLGKGNHQTINTPSNWSK